MVFRYQTCPRFVENVVIIPQGGKVRIFTTKGKKRFLRHSTHCLQNRSDLKEQEEWDCLTKQLNFMSDSIFNMRYFWRKVVQKTTYSLLSSPLFCFLETNAMLKRFLLWCSNKQCTSVTSGVTDDAQDYPLLHSNNRVYLLLRSLGL